MKLWEWGGESRKSTKVIRGDHFSEVAFKGGIGQISPCLALNPPPPPAGYKKMTGPLHTIFDRKGPLSFTSY